MRVPFVLPIALVATLLLAACAPSGTSQPQPDPEPTQDAVELGTEWTTLEGSGPLDGDGDFTPFGAAGWLWVYDRDEPAVLHGTDDGADWVELDLAEAGLPVDAKLGRSLGVVLNDRGDEFTVIFHSTSPGGHPAALDILNWLVEVTVGDSEDPTATVTSGSAAGLETMPSAVNGWAFRTAEITGLAALNDVTYAIGNGQWWQPYKTGTLDAFAATRGGSSWSVASMFDAPLGGYDYDVGPVALVATANDLVALAAKRGSEAYPFEVWLSADGVAWESISATFEGAAADHAVESVTVGEAGIVAVGMERADGVATPIAWASADGRSWVRTELQGTGTATGVFATSSGFLAVGEIDSDSAAWTSADGRVWEPVTVELPNGVDNAVAVGAGLAIVHSSGMRVSGLAWGQAD